MDLSDYQDVSLISFDLKSALTGYLPGDEPVLEELGINFNTIKTEAQMIFHPISEPKDLSGPLIFILIYSFFLLLSGKLHFGYIYFISLSTTLFTYVIINLISRKSIDLLSTSSIMGYSFIPIILFQPLSFFLPLTLRIFVSLFFTFWASFSSTKNFIFILNLSDKFFIVFYPIFLCYSVFVLLAIF